MIMILLFVAVFCISVYNVSKVVYGNVFTFGSVIAHTRKTREFEIILILLISISSLTTVNSFNFTEFSSSDTNTVTPP